MNINYNSIDIIPLSIIGFSLDPEWSEDRTEYLWTKLLLEVSGLINLSEMSYEGNPPVGTGGLAGPGTFPAVTLASIRAALLTPRRPLLLDIFGDVLVKSPAAGFAPGDPDFTVDCQNGPIPGPITVEFDGGRTFRTRFKIETWLRDPCLGGAAANPALVSVRFGQSDSVDEQQLTARTTTGVAKFRTDVLAKDGKTPDDYRGILFPLPPLGFRRVGFQAMADSNRGTLRFTVTDREQMFDFGPTDPRHPLNGSGIIATPDIHYTVSTITAEGIAAPGRIAQVSVTCKGSKYASTWRMTQELVKIAARKLPLSRPDGIVLHAQLGQSTGAATKECSVAYTVRIPLDDQQFKPPGADDQITLPFDEGLQVDDPYQGDVAAGRNPQLLNRDGTAGTFDGVLLTAALTAACGNRPDLPHNVKGEGVLGETDEAPEFPVIVSLGVVLEVESTLISTDGATTNYTSYGIDITHEKNEWKIQCPVAGPPGSLTKYLTACRPTALRRIHWTAERVGEYPRIPNPQVNDPNLVLIDSWILPKAPITNPTGAQAVWHVDGMYLYGLKEPKGAGDVLPMGSLPWSNLYYAGNTIHLDHYEHGIIDQA